VEHSEDVPVAAMKDRACDWCHLTREVPGIQLCVRDRLDIGVPAIRAHDRKFHGSTYLTALALQKPAVPAQKDAVAAVPAAEAAKRDGNGLSNERGAEGFFLSQHL